jgi:hypothetical protein
MSTVDTINQWKPEKLKLVWKKFTKKCIFTRYLSFWYYSQYYCQNVDWYYYCIVDYVKPINILMNKAIYYFFNLFSWLDITSPFFIKFAQTIALIYD